MKDWRATLVTPNTPAIEAIKVIEGTPAKICLVVDPEDRLLGTVTDGDIRRAIL